MIELLLRSHRCKVFFTILLLFELLSLQLAPAHRTERLLGRLPSRDKLLIPVVLLHPLDEAARVEQVLAVRLPHMSVLHEVIRTDGARGLLEAAVYLHVVDHRCVRVDKIRGLVPRLDGLRETHPEVSRQGREQHIPWLRGPHGVQVQAWNIEDCLPHQGAVYCYLPRIIAVILVSARAQPVDNLPVGIHVELEYHLYCRLPHIQLYSF